MKKKSPLDGKVVYLAGPITDCQHYRAKFKAVEMELLDHSRVVLNPAVLPDGLAHDAYMRITVPMMLEAEVVLFLPGWRASAGAMIEHREARAKGLTQYELLGFTFPLTPVAI